MTASVVVTPLLIALSFSQVMERDDTANLGDYLDANDVPAREDAGCHR